jgi:hypothetical protein
MFNHARTLLMNLSGDTGDLYISDYPGDEMIPAGYRAVALPTYLQVVRSRLFGVTPDRAMLNYRVAQLLQLIEATELQSHILALDSRITYSSYPRQLALDSTFQPTVRRFGGLPTDILSVIGNATRPDFSGKAYYNYQVTVVDESTLGVQRLTFPLAYAEYELTYSQELSPQYALPFSDYKVQITRPSTNLTWNVRGCMRPQLSLDAIDTNLRSIGEPYLLQLFGAAPVEPFTTFRNCWKNHPEFAYRLGGIVLALIYRTEEIYRGK